MKIEVAKHWRGVASDLRRVFPGVYDIDDPRLWGAGQAMLEEGAAVVVAKDAPPVPEKVETVVVDAPAEDEPVADKPTPSRRRR